MRATLLVLAGLAAPLAAQQPTPPTSPTRPASGCRFRLEYVGGLGQQVIAGTDTNYFAAGGVRIRCAGTSVTMTSDSVAFYGRRGGSLAEFVGQVRYRDTTVTMNADRGTYFKNGERWEARGNVVTENLENGSTLQGPSLDYFRLMPGVRDTVELFAVGRPTINYIPRDSSGRRSEPYVVIGDRVRMKGNDRIWAGGKVTINRSDFAARSDSLFLFTGPGGRGALMGDPQMQGLGRDSFRLTGSRIDLTLDGQALRYVLALGNGRAVSSSVDLVADTIGLDLERDVLIQTLAWGDSLNPRGLTSDYEVRGDSLAFDTPDQRLREVRSFTRGWVGSRADSATGERDWLAGDTVIASFAAVDSAGTTRSVVNQIEAQGNARSYYRVADRRRGGPPSINYSRGDRITVKMKTAGDRSVDRVDIRGRADGIHLEPLALLPDSAQVDSLRTRRRP
jgi:hypothetical protein